MPHTQTGSHSHCLSSARGWTLRLELGDRAGSLRNLQSLVQNARGSLFKKILRISRQLEQSIKLCVGPPKHRVLCACVGYTSMKQVSSRTQAGRCEREGGRLSQPGDCGTQSVGCGGHSHCLVRGCTLRVGVRAPN